MAAKYIYYFGSLPEASLPLLEPRKEYSLTELTNIGFVFEDINEDGDIIKPNIPRYYPTLTDLIASYVGEETFEDDEDDENDQGDFDLDLQQERWDDILNNKIVLRQRKNTEMYKLATKNEMEDCFSKLIESELDFFMEEEMSLQESATKSLYSIHITLKGVIDKMMGKFTEAHLALRAEEGWFIAKTEEGVQFGDNKSMDLLFPAYMLNILHNFGGNVPFLLNVTTDSKSGDDFFVEAFGGIIEYDGEADKWGITLMVAENVKEIYELPTLEGEIPKHNESIIYCDLEGNKIFPDV
jgi:hypothetical protein